MIPIGRRHVLLTDNWSRMLSLLQFYSSDRDQEQLKIDQEQSCGTVFLITQTMKRRNKILCCLITINKALKINRQAKPPSPFGLTEDSLLDQLLLTCKQIKSIY